MCRCMWADSVLWWHFVVTAVYFIGLTVLPFSYVFFHWGRWRTIAEIIDYDTRRKIDDDIIV